MAIYSTELGFNLNSIEISQVVDILLETLIDRGVEIDHGNLPGRSNGILLMLVKGNEASKDDPGFLHRVATLAPAMMRSMNVQDGPGLEDIILSIGESFAEIANLEV